MRLRRRRLAAISLAAVAFAFAWWVRCGPLPEGMLDLDEHVSTEVVARDGEPLRESLSAAGQRSRRTSADHLPEALVGATLAAEDARFFHHPGVDPIAVARALWHDLRARRMLEGGSTLTQQTVKILTHRERTAAGKLREAVLAMRLEHRLSKREILALYLSIAPYGSQVQGAEAASRAYFGTSAENLTAAQAALLAGLPQRPTALDPRRHFEAARQRQLWVLGRMRALGSLSPEDYEAARQERLRIARAERAFLAPHFVESVLASVTGPAPRRIETTLDAPLQREVAGIVDMHRVRLLGHGAHNVAVAVLDNRTSEWRAWEGSGDYLDQDHGGAIDGVVTPRQPGSALKPFTYALAFEHGYTPASVLPDLPTHFPTAVDGILYSPRNYDGVFRGPLRARAALAGSENVPAVWLLSRTGVPDLLRVLRRVGLTTLEKTPDYYGYALTMGDAEVRLDELVAAYAAIARGGSWRRPAAVRSVVRDGGNAEVAIAPGTPLGEERVVSPRAAFWLADVLSDPLARAYIFGSGGSLDFPFPVAVKTGTSQAYHDNWTIGFTRDVTVGVWVGNFDRTPLRNSSGVTGAAPIFHDVMMAAQQRIGGRLPGGDEPLVERPSDLSPRAICALSGRDATEWCPRLESEWIPIDRPAAPCRWHRQVGGRVAVSWPPAYRAWARDQGLLDTTTAGASAPASPRVALPRVARAASTERLRIVNPPPGAVYLFDPTLRAQFQTLPLRAVTEMAGSRLAWEVDGRPVGVASAERALDWPLARGPHTVAVSDGVTRDETSIVVR